VGVPARLGLRQLIVLRAACTSGRDDVITHARRGRAGKAHTAACAVRPRRRGCPRLVRRDAPRLNQELPATAPPAAPRPKSAAYCRRRPDADAPHVALEVRPQQPSTTISTSRAARAREFAPCSTAAWPRTRLRPPPRWSGHLPEIAAHHITPPSQTACSVTRTPSRRRRPPEHRGSSAPCAQVPHLVRRPTSDPRRVLSNRNASGGAIKRRRELPFGPRHGAPVPLSARQHNSINGVRELPPRRAVLLLPGLPLDAESSALTDPETAAGRQGHARGGGLHRAGGAGPRLGLLSATLSRSSRGRPALLASLFARRGGVFRGRHPFQACAPAPPTSPRACRFSHSCFSAYPTIVGARIAAARRPQSDSAGPWVSRRQTVTFCLSGRGEPPPLARGARGLFEDGPRLPRQSPALPPPPAFRRARRGRHAAFFGRGLWHASRGACSTSFARWRHANGRRWWRFYGPPQRPLPPMPPRPPSTGAAAP